MIYQKYDMIKVREFKLEEHFFTCLNIYTIEYLHS